MKVLFIHTLYPPYVLGGAELSLQTLVEGLAARGVEVVVLTTGDQPGLHEDVQNGIRVWRAGLRNVYWHFRTSRAHVLRRRAWHSVDVYNPLMASYVRRIVELERPDVASCHNLPGWSISAWRALHEQGIPIVQVLHDFYLACPASTMFKNDQNCQHQCASCRLMRLPHPRMSRRLAGVVGVSRFVLDYHRRLGYFEGVRVQRVIHNARSPQTMGLGSESYAAEHAQRPLRFGFIGTLVPSKGIELLLRTFAEQPTPDAELWVAGSGYAEYEAALKRKSNGIAVRWLGRVKPSDFFPGVDVVIVPSLWREPLGMTVAEALAFGRPVIGARRGGIPEMITDGVNGLLFEPEQPHQLAEAMRRLSTDARMRAQMSEAARVSAAPFFDMDRFLGEYQSVYQAVRSTPV